MRKLHRTIGLFFAPFLACSALTGLLWAYAPYLYLKPEPAKTMAKAPAIDESGSYLPVADALRAARRIIAEGRVASVSLKQDGDRLVYVVFVAAKNGQQEIRVDMKGKAELVVPTTGQKIHYWVKKLHEFQFFGTKKELTVFSGTGLLLLLTTGFILLRKKI